ncbi:MULTISPECIES: DUF721 domain-containing protein [Cedecea]|uniref:DUF721 domain-containing protein n=1 Tax=Cedecea davisae DSM 4568 TaxID=566551 RepID=S3J832_9ENTR|nr:MULTISPECIES: DciA family protein [Cedecea]EPF20821.1 hypothetical protein HMPREF0201_00556 [Cedecea davisae DSM 4568]QIX95128.1 DUF721 domain-containing protein [Cedecea sp. FDAARGOS_727]SUX36404.1 Zn-ribbon-containing, possibly RNA-binding protein and truncated derivatives [Cedecea davisae]
MRDSRPQSLENLFDDAGQESMLQNVQQRAVALLRLNRAVKGILPAPLHPWCRVANFRQGILVLETANASWLMRLRYEQATLLSALRAQILPSLTSIDIRINPLLAVKGQEIVQQNTTQTGAEKYEVNRQLSEQSAEALREVAKRSPEKLRATIERLASLAGEVTSKTSRNR